MRRLAAVAMVCAVSSIECWTHTYPPSDIVSSARILAVVSEPPALTMSGGATQVHVLSGGLRGPATPRWWWCDPRGGLQVSLFGEAVPQVAPSADCLAGGASAHTIGSGATVMLTVPGDYYASAVAFVASNYDDAGNLVDWIAMAAGVDVVVVVSVDDGDGPILGVGRVNLSAGVSLNHNPPPVILAFGDPSAGVITLAAAAGSDTCASASGTRPIVAHDAQVAIAPAPAYTHWAETYLAVDAFGRLSTATEIPSFRVFATDGSHPDPVCGGATNPATCSWIAPSVPAVVTHWFVAYDGRGGVAACRFDVEVR